jgi:diguanylate cyclase (GGDEF)-like protein
VIKLVFGKVSLYYGTAAFIVVLTVLLLAPVISGNPVSSLTFSVLQAGLIALILGIIPAYFHEHKPAVDRDTSDSGNLGVVHRTDTDPLTHTLNQRGLTVKLLETMALGERYGNNLALAIVGIDHLDEVVEEYSRAVANKALVAIASEMTDSLRMPDVLGRWADDQFIAVLPETPLEGAKQIGERLRESVSSAQFEGRRGVMLTLTASIGVTVFRMGDDLHGLLSRATRAMNAAKSQGCDRVRTDLAA